MHLIMTSKKLNFEDFEIEKLSKKQQKTEMDMQQSIMTFLRTHFSNEFLAIC